ncbi:MAG TPA: PilZ domain-containing protein [Thermoanaerobaculia bacterium]|nr:PilZ domain-containing protein [Thermoanaerobaculia bacterium]
MEQRRSPRVVRLVPLTLSDGDRTLEARSAVINAHGALILSPVSVTPGTTVALSNRRTGASIEGTVVWEEPDPPTAYKLGVEFERPSPEFWGADYPS